MGEEDGPKGGGTGQIGPNPSTDTTACQTPNQPDIPAWMVARNNSVHAPVFGQPSARKSRKLLSTPVSVSKTDTTQSPVMQSQARDMAIEPKVPPLPLNPSPSVELDTLNDDQALALLLKNETVAGLLQDAFNTRVLEYQQKLQRAYNQRLIELEDYTRSWRDTTKELWSALSEGTVKPNNDQREALLWNGPQDAGLDFNPELPTAPQETVEKEVDSNGRVACISIKHSRPSHSVSKVVCRSWIKDKQESGGTSRVHNITQQTSPKPDDATVEGCERSTSPERSKPPYAWLFQRTIALSDGLKKLNSSTSRESPDFQHKHQGLAMGGEPKEVRSPSPTEQKTPVISRRLAHGGKMGIPPKGFANQENGEAASDDGGSSDLIMLDGQPTSFTAPQREKHSLSPINHEDSTAKRFRLSATEGSMGHVGQLSQDVSNSSAHQILAASGLAPLMQARVITQNHLDKPGADSKKSQDGLQHRSDNSCLKDVPEKIMRQDGDIDLVEPNLHALLARESEEAHTTDEPKHQVFPSLALRAQSLPLGNRGPSKVFNTVPPSSAITAREIQKIEKQLQELENYVQDSVDQLDENTLAGKIQRAEQLRIDVERFQNVLEAQHDIEEMTAMSEGLRSGAHPPLHDVSQKLQASSDNPISVLTEPMGAKDPRSVLAGKSNITPMIGINLFSPVNEVPAPEVSAVPRQSSRTTPTEPKAFRGVPTEPKAMRMATPHPQKSHWQYLPDPRAISVGPITQIQASQAESSPKPAPETSLATRNQFDASHGWVQSETNPQKPLRAVLSSPPPSCPREPL